MSIVKKCSICASVTAVVLVLSAVFFVGNACASSRQDEISARVAQLFEEKKGAEKDLISARKQLNRKEKELQKAQTSSKKKDSRIKQLTKEVETQNTKINRLERKIQSLEKEIQQLRTRLDARPQEGASSGWHPNAECRVTGFTYKPGDPSVRLKVQYRSGEYADPDPETSETGNDGVQYFVIEGLPAGLQIVVPSGYTVNVDGREGYVAKIDPNNIEGAALDYKSNIERSKDKNGKIWIAKTFTSGEVFIIMKQSGMTIRPPFATAPRR